MQQAIISMSAVSSNIRYSPTSTPTNHLATCQQDYFRDVTREDVQHLLSYCSAVGEDDHLLAPLLGRYYAAEDAEAPVSPAPRKAVATPKVTASARWQEQQEQQAQQALADGDNEVGALMCCVSWHAAWKQLQLTS